MHFLIAYVEVQVLWGILFCGHVLKKYWGGLLFEHFQLSEYLAMKNL